MKPHTEQQRRAIEVLCRKYAEAFNDAGYDLPAVLEKKVIPVSWTQDSVKDLLFKAVMKALCYDEAGNPKTSTTQLDSSEVSIVHQHLDKWVGERFSITVPFPSEEELYAEKSHKT